MLEDRGALSKEEADLVREYKAMYGENFLVSWPREDKEVEQVRRRSRVEEVKTGRREAEGKMERVSVGCKRACCNFLSLFLGNFSREEVWLRFPQNAGKVNDCVSVLVSVLTSVLDLVADVSSVPMCISEFGSCPSQTFFLPREAQCQWHVGV